MTAPAATQQWPHNFYLLDSESAPLEAATAVTIFTPRCDYGHKLYRK
jgi:hypothetical protein